MYAIQTVSTTPHSLKALASKIASTGGTVSRGHIPRAGEGVLLLSHFSRARLCDPIDGSPPGSPVPGILQARTLEWVAISFSNA